MSGLSTSTSCRRHPRVSLGSLLLLVLIGTACGTDAASLATEAAIPADTTAGPSDTTTVPGDTVPGDTTAAPTDTSVTPDSTVPPSDSGAAGETVVPAIDASVLPGITFGTNNMPTSALNSVHTGTLFGGPLSPTNIVSVLTAVRAKGGRIVIKLCKGNDSYVKNADGTFSLTKWKALVSQYRNVGLGPFIADGTILGHYLIDEPHRTARWGGKIISHATIEAMAAHSKLIWSTMPTLVRVVPSWLATSSITYRHLDAAWLQYAARLGDVTQLATAEVAAAKRKALGLVVGMNVIDGGNGSSGIRGGSAGKYSMSAAELRTYGTGLLNQSYACGFYMYNHNTTYYGRSDIKTAMAELSAKARVHAKTSCRQ